MRYRKLSDETIQYGGFGSGLFGVGLFGVSPTTIGGGDFVFGRGPSEYLVNSSACVAQAIRTALLLFQGEWFLDSTAGMPWFQQVLGNYTASLYDTAIKNEILGVQGVASIASYSSTLNTKTRSLTVSVIVNTIYGQAPVTVQMSFPPVPPPGPTGYGEPPPFGGS
jgi:hypothetical protein